MSDGLNLRPLRPGSGLGHSESASLSSSNESVRSVVEGGGRESWVRVFS
jgi:hypothetical protein